MATELNNAVEDSEMADCDGEKVVTMMDVLQEQEEFEEDVNAVLGASDDKDCTYSKGYIKRQAIYACVTCCSDAKNDPTKRAGVCLACSLTCHENHDLIELYTKRNFKCDCGNPKFNSNPCHFTPDKTDLNEDNNYNQNFSGVYCICQKPYPDPDTTTDIEMIQCVICEDWLHATHLEATVPDNDQYSEMICKGCMEKNLFLHDYGSLAVNIDVDVVTNGIDSELMCNGDAESDTVKDDNVKATDVEMAEKVSDNITSNTEVGLNGNDDSKDEDFISDIEKSSIENKDDEESVETPMETEESNKLHSDSTTETPIENVTENVAEDSKGDRREEDSTTEKVIGCETIEQSIAEKAIGSESNEERTTEKAIGSESNVESTTAKALGSELIEEIKTEKAIVSETVTEEQQNDTSSDHAIDTKQAESTTESENTENNVKSAKQLEEDSLLAEPNDDSKKSKVDEEGDIKKDNSNVQNSEVPEAEQEDNKSCETGITETDENTLEINEAAMVDNKPISEVTQYELDNIDGPTEVNEKEVELSGENPLIETNSSAEDKTETAEAQDNLEQNESKIKTDTVQSNDVIQNGDTEKKTGEKRKLLIEENIGSEIKKTKLDENNATCIRPKGVKRVHKGATFWPTTFRQKLCTCRECMTMYNDLSVLFLLDPEDTVTAYENLGKQKVNGKPVSQYEKGLAALSSLGRIQQINALTEYNKMRDKLLDFLKSFKDRQEVVKEEDIKAFFAGMKPKREPDGVYFCR